MEFCMYESIIPRIEAGLVIRIQLEPQWVGHSRSSRKTDHITPAHLHTRTQTCKHTYFLHFFNLQISLQETEYVRNDDTRTSFCSSPLPAVEFAWHQAPTYLFLPELFSAGCFSSAGTSTFPGNFMFWCILRQLMLLPNICVGRPANLELGTYFCPTCAHTLHLPTHALTHASLDVHTPSRV